MKKKTSPSLSMGLILAGLLNISPGVASENGDVNADRGDNILTRNRSNSRHYDSVEEIAYKELFLFTQKRFEIYSLFYNESYKPLIEINIAHETPELEGVGSSYTLYCNKMTNHVLDCLERKRKTSEPLTQGEFEILQNSGFKIEVEEIEGVKDYETYLMNFKEKNKKKH